MLQLFIIKNFIFNCVYLAMTPYPSDMKMQIFLAYLKLTTTLLFIDPIARFKQTTVLGLTIEAFNYRTLQYLFGEIFVRNEYFFQTDVKKPVIIDCGSNIGMSVIFFKFLYPHATIHAFEPDPVTFALLEKNIKVNKLSDVHLHNEAVSDKKDQLTFYTEVTPGSLLMSVIKDRISGKEIKVPAISLADFMKKLNVTFLKMDIEGHENAVMKDLASKKILSSFDKMAIEYHHNIPAHPSRLAEFLVDIEKAGFNYQIDAASIPVIDRKFQDILIAAYK